MKSFCTILFRQCLRSAAIFMLVLLTVACGSGVERLEDQTAEAEPCEALAPYPRETLPEGIARLTNDRDPVFA
ncbi:MAG TPA: hypothetical protein VLT88_15015, partial [Desulfosarcina sp.]|nr:hypothetical protein [Desulfosarcina sp.]